MPGYDGTGPIGRGPMTGGGRGFCNTGQPYIRRGVGGRTFGRGGRCFGFGLGHGWGAGRGRGGSPFPAGWSSARTMSKAEELEMLRTESEELNRTLDDIRNRMEALERSGAESE
ncbi:MULTISPECIES: DUF5320 domain-containing protein [Desulfococcus]|uniref:Uncharacterized protein n=1 Tax=Desulfococcus multivorans DSM 2059 TaxID=1121405 RepID=S7VEJ0_DESML|nr:DUF5320 domain-containing protein [Desulfococcus multivorans]AOY59433.1 uncharacterized protein Dmul_26610 [Desulfococcus multivorans]EPR42853.1 hypothetical protein dsmv_1504 [Desulfococcus multivorans DSM 2059]MDX9817681.1 DUF5320 domain-containing protein [Desulfococcus multivorans]SKA00693.1 hypothetical protein SAMN02745446_02385 [Desulfococcus multivorans DSM 2059]